MIDLNVSKTLYESSTALGFKRSMHIEEGKEVYIIYISIYIYLYVLSTHVSQPPLMIVHYISVGEHVHFQIGQDISHITLRLTLKPH